MQYFIAFLEGVITFLSPCLLPMLPVYLSYFAGGGERSTRKTLAGALAGTAGQLLQQYHTAVNIVCGAVVIFFGLCYLGVIKLTLFRGSSRTVDTQMGFGAAVLFGVVFSLGWTPCVGAFLGSALALASQQGHVLVGMAMLLAYSLGLGVPFVLSAVLIDRLKTAFDWVKRHYGVLNRVCGVFLIVVGVLMATGLMGRFLNLLS